MKQVIINYPKNIVLEQDVETHICIFIKNAENKIIGILARVQDEQADKWGLYSPHGLGMVEYSRKALVERLIHYGYTLWIE